MELKYKNIKEIFISIFVGFSIGLSVIVPGISGSSIAIILKVYDKLMYAFSNIFKRFKICFVFLLPILLGIIIGFALGFILVKILLEAFPFITICFFVGLMVGTYPILFKEIKGNKPKLKNSVLFVVGIIIPLAISLISLQTYTSNSLSDINLMHYVLFLIIGVLISLTQLIPGLSATVLLMIFGYYTALINGINRQLFSSPKLILVYVMLVIGFIIGILLFSKVINKVLASFRKQFFFLICGLSSGSIISVFCGRECIEIYQNWNKANIFIDVSLGMVALIIGFTITFLIYFLNKKKQNTTEKNISEN